MYRLSTGAPADAMAGLFCRALQEVGEAVYNGAIQKVMRGTLDRNSEGGCPVAEETPLPLIVPQSTDEIKTTAEYFRRGLMLGMHSVANVMPWLDMILTTELMPDVALIEASLSGSRGPIAVADWLAETPGVFDKRIVTGRLLGAIGVLLRRDPAQAPIVARWLYQMALDGDAPDEAAEEPMWYFDDALGLAADGVYGSTEELCEELRTFLVRYDHST